MRSRFESDKRLLVNALSEQKAVFGDPTVAEMLADLAAIVEYASGEKIISQGEIDNDVYFILSGNVSIHVHGREVARRSPGQHIGEMALINPGGRRSATVIAIDNVTAAKLSEASIDRIATSKPRLWRSFASELCDRLAERNKFVRIPNDRPAIFIGCAAESLALAEQVQLAFRFDRVDVRVWTDDVFGASSFPLMDLEAQIERTDFGVLLLSADDEVTSRTKTMNAPRDNVIFELGLFIGGLGHSRTFLVKPRGIDLKIPSDLLGLTPLEYTLGAPTAAKLLRTEIWNAVERLGVR